MRLPNRVIVLTIYLILSVNIQLFAQVNKAPANVAATLTIKLLTMEKNISGSGGDVTIYVMGSGDVAKELKNAVGKAIGSAKLSDVISGDELPAVKPTILFVGDPSTADQAVQYTRSQKIASVTNIPELVAKGVTLGLGIGGDGKPKILLNISSSSEEGLDWNPAIMKIAQVVK